jgi:Flp pilus assembly protein TadD
LAAVLALTLLPPLWQAWTLRAWFVEQGVGLATPDNPVVRAHLALGRLIAADTPYLIVNPAAVFGPIGPVVAAGVWLALRRRSAGDAYLVALTLVPAAVLFVPLLAAGVGMLTVPWMLYRIGWLIPQPLLLARVFAAALAREGALSRWSAVVVCGVVLLLLTVPTAADRLRRGMREHPFSDEMFPRGTTLAAYRFLDRAARPGAVLAPVGFSNLVPALTGRNVVAFSERGTLVFAGSEANAYARLRDRATFFACTTEAVTRKQIVDDYGVAYAVFRRRYRTTGDELAWLERATADGVLLAADPALPIACSTSEEQLVRLLPEGWTIVFANTDYFIVETDAVAQLRPRVPSESASARWLDVVGAESDDPRDEADLLASATGFPGGYVSVDPVPSGLGIGSELLWAAGGALWDDGPIEVAIEMKLTSACPVTSVEVIPYLETRRREVLEIRVDDRVRAVHARDGIPRRIALERRNRDSLRLVVRSRLGLPFGVADVRLFGDRAACVGGWRPLARPEVSGRPVPLAAYFALVNGHPRSPRAALDLATRVGEVTSTEDAISTLRRGLSREPGQAAAWIELGLRLDAVGRFEEARGAYRRARAVDSNSAWAHGCLAWADLRAGRPVAALWHAWRAERLDPRYADAVTISALAWERLGGMSLSVRALDRAIEMGPRRGWPHYERARQLADDGRREEARALLRRYRALVPDDPIVSERLRALAAGDSVGN